MLCRHTIELPKGTPGPRHNLIAREELADWAQANQLLSHANAQAEALISQAERQCEALLETASLQIWQRADSQLKRWERERQAMLDNLEHYATAITQQAIRSVLDDTVAPQRLAALLRQLLASQVPEIDATLLCHPQDLEAIKHCLADHQATVWKVQADETIPTHTLVLKTEEGDFRISWSALLKTFSNPTKAAG